MSETKQRFRKRAAILTVIDTPRRIFPLYECRASTMQGALDFAIREFPDLFKDVPKKISQWERLRSGGRCIPRMILRTSHD